MRKKTWAACLLAAFILLLCLFAFLARTTWLEAMGHFLVDTQPPERSDMIVVLGGDWYGNRILKAAQLAKDGYAPRVLVSGGGYIYGRYEADYAIPYAVSHGFDPKLFLPLRYPVFSTREEAAVVIPELRRQGVKRYILVTNEFHSRRAGSLFRKMAPDLELRVVPSPDTLHWNNWWRDREGRKTFLLEWTKTLTATVGV